MLCARFVGVVSSVVGIVQTKGELYEKSDTTQRGA